MNTVIVLFWLLIAPSGDGNMQVIPEATIEQCQKDGDRLAKESMAAKDAGDIKDFYGSCIPLDLSAATKDKRGSI